ncbi:surface antigen (D15) [Candidatus Koribacter versatilis Ellin345]|uniref:Surface antigen (D15) n=1 Tax=Koribacter versatilis (strain Ellin345) TaxID=204669 RepID=Q1IMU5_KORVE|nr:outer membrane protein assembly factor [Candidatus Koribacter versatilis]ABF41805.1 surface antigen (D15) [Candidatus Koribacter versatilis Ellin345]
MRGRVAGAVLFLACLCATRMWAQGSADPGTQIMQSYEGQNVSVVEIAGQPDIDTSKYESVLKQHQGQPFSMEKVAATVEALKKTGDFKDVILDLRPETSGVHVMFIAQPAYYIALYDFPGALKNFPYSRLIQVANYQSQEPYSKLDIETAQKSLEKFFHQVGFFEATVQPEIRLNKEHGIVNVDFTTTLKRHAKFGEVKIEGATLQDTAFLQGKVRGFMARTRGAQIRPGKPYSSRKIQLATNYLQGALAKQQHLGADVKFVTAEYDPATNVANVVFHVKVGPKVEVDIVGAHLWPWTRKKLIPIYIEGSIDEDLIEEGERNLHSYFQSKGFYDAVVKTDVKQNAELTTISYTITKNEKHKVERLDVEGNNSISSKDLLNNSQVEKAHFYSHGKFSEDLVRKSSASLRAVYLNAGYSKAKVTPRVTRDRGNIVVTYVVEEGPRDYVAELHIVGNDTVPMEQLSPKGLQLGVNRPYSPLFEQQDRNNIAAHYLTNGYLTAGVTSKAVPVSKSDPHHLIVTYKIHEGPKVTTARIITVGKQQTKQEIVDRASVVKVGVPLSEADLLSSESRLYAMGIFDWAQVDPKRGITSQNQEEVLIKVHETKRNTITYGFGFEVINRGGSVPGGTVSVPGIPPVGLPQGFRTSESTFWGPRGTFSYTRRNVRGLAESYTLGAFAGRLDQRVFGNYTIPYLLASSWSGAFQVSGEHDATNPVFSALNGAAGFQVQRYLDAKQTKQLFFRYKFQYTDLSNIFPGFEILVPEEDRRVRLSTLSTSFVRDTRDNILDAHKGTYGTVDLGITPQALGSSETFARFLGQFAFYKQIPHGIIWANSFRLGIETPFGGSHVPTSELFFSGGGSTLRGFPLNGAGPQQYTTVCGDPNDTSTCGPITVPTGGKQLIIVNSELRIPLNQLYKGLGIVPFYDGGNVYKHVGFSSFSTNCNAAATTSTGSNGQTVTLVEPSCFTSSIGLGVRYNTPIGPVRLDVGHNLNHITGIKSTQVFITLGQAF